MVMAMSPDSTAVALIVPLPAVKGKLNAAASGDDAAADNYHEENHE
jgi:hypothetical protein